MGVGDKIRSARKARHMTQEQVAVPAGTGTGNLSRIEQGKQVPSIDLLRAIARAIGVPVQSLMDDDVIADSARASDSMTGQIVVRDMFPGRTPLIPWSRIGDWQELKDGAVDQFEWIPCSRKFAYGKAAASILEGDSMLSRTDPSFPAGTILTFAEATTAKPGEYVLVLAGGSRTFKRLVEDAGDYYLQPLNDAFPLRPLGDAVIAGVLVEALRIITP